MLSKKFLFVTSLFISASVAAVVVIPNVNLDTLSPTKATDTQKEFVFDSSVASQVPYDGGEGPYTRYVTTGMSSNIAVKLYRESGEASETTNRDGCFYGANYSNERTFAFEAGLNNLVGFEIRFKYSYDAKYDGDYTHFNYSVEMTFYSGKNVVHVEQYPTTETTRETVYTHTWTKAPEILEKIDYVKCSLANGGGSSRHDWRVLKILHYKAIWTC